MDDYYINVLSKQQPETLKLFFSLFNLTDEQFLRIEDFCEQVDECESPIEKMLLAALEIKAMQYEDSYEVSIWTQYDSFPIDKKYRADFYIRIDNGPWHCLYGKKLKEAELLIECDGHQFHEKTKAQVKYRNERDLELKKAGYDILHFSGSQIYNEPMKCADEIFNYLIIKAEGKNNG